MAWVAAQVEMIAAANGGVILTRHLVEAGFTDAQIRYVRRRLHRLCRGAYCLTKPSSSDERHRLAARGTIQRYGTTVALSHVSAALLHGLPLWDVDTRRVHLTGVHRNHVRRGGRHGIQTHVGPLGRNDLTEIGGLRVTSLARTAVDCARGLPRAQGVAVVDAVLHREGATVSGLQARVSALTAHEGVARARRALALADPAAESPGETRTRLILLGAGFPLESQVTLRSPAGEFLARVDFRVVGTNVVVEFDGREKYSLAGDLEAAHWQEKTRQMRLERAGFQVVRFVWADLADPEAVAAMVGAAVRGQ